MKREFTAPSVVINRVLERIDRERMTTSSTFKGDKNLISFREQVTPFLIQVLVQGCEGVAIHVDNPLQISFAVTDTDTAITTFNISKADGNGFTDSQTGDPHE